MQILAPVFMSNDAKEGAVAFAEKRRAEVDGQLANTSTLNTSCWGFVCKTCSRGAQIRLTSTTVEA